MQTLAPFFLFSKLLRCSPLNMSHATVKTYCYVYIVYGTVHVRFPLFLLYAFKFQIRPISDFSMQNSETLRET